MPETKKLQTTTVFNINRPYVEILTYYDKDGSGNFPFFFISQYERTMEGVKVGIGDLVERVMGDADDFYVDDEGNLIVDSDDPDSYSIRELDGYLMQETDD